METAADNKRRCRHFWKWVTAQKKMLKADVDKDKCLQKLLRAEHAIEFPSLYCHTKSFRVAESVKEFYRKMLKFNSRLREDETFAYSDQMFDNLELFDGEIDKNKEEAFKKHYFAGYTNFLKHRKGGHRNYQMHYLYTIFKNFKRVQRNNRDAIKKVLQDAQRKKAKDESLKMKQERALERLRKEEEKAKKQAAEEEMKKYKAEGKAKKQKEKQDLLLQKREEMEKRKTVKQMKKNIEEGQ